MTGRNNAGNAERKIMSARTVEPIQTIYYAKRRRMWRQVEAGAWDPAEISTQLADEVDKNRSINSRKPFVRKTSMWPQLESHIENAVLVFGSKTERAKQRYALAESKNPRMDSSEQKRKEFTHIAVMLLCSPRSIRGPIRSSRECRDPIHF